MDEDICSGCGICIPVCPYDARELGGMQPNAKVNEILCEGCGICVAVCPSGASQQKNETDAQIGNMIEALL